MAEIDPAAFTTKNVFDSPGKVISGVSVALRVGRAMYIGAFEGERIVRIAVQK